MKKKIAPAPAKSVQPPVSEAPDAAAPRASDLMPMDVEGPGGTAGSEPAADLPERRDPFRSFIEVKSGSATSRKKVRRVQTPLQKYSLDQLKVVGVIDGGKVKKALLEDDVGKGYVVGKGDYVGNQGGRIVSIKSDRIVIQEERSNALGETTVRKITKKLYAVKKDGLQ